MSVTVPKIENLSVQEAAAQIVALIHSRPTSPRRDEIEAIITRSWVGDLVGGHPPDKPITSSADIEFQPILHPDTGKPLEFEFSIQEFANAFYPAILVAFKVIGADRQGVRRMVEELARDPEDPEAELLFSLVENWEVMQDKFEALSHFVGAAWARTMAVMEALVDEGTEAGQVLNRGAGRELAKARELAEQAEPSDAKSQPDLC